MSSPDVRRRRRAAAHAGRDFDGGAGRLVRVAALPLADAAGIAAAIAVSGAARRPLVCALYAAAMLGIMAGRRQHRLRVCLRAADQAGAVVTAAILPLPALLAWLPGRRLAVLALCCAGFVLTCRVAMCGALRAAHRRGRLTELAVVVGAGTFGGYVAGLMRDHPEFGLRPAGLVDDGPPRRDLAVPTLGTTARLQDVLADFGIGRVIVCFSSDCRDENLVTVLRAAAGGPLGTDVCVVPRFYELGMAVPRGCLDELWGVPLVPLRRPPRAGLVVKRAMDLAAALVLAPVALPLALTLAAVMRLRSGPPAMFRQGRLTGDGSVSPVLKLRTVPVQAGLDTRWAVPGEQCDPFARWLRATHLDELPQLVNVLRGEMSLSGPRPERPYFAERFRREIPRYADRTRMPGGLTGWAQVNGLNGDTSVFDRVRFDNYYAEYWSPWFDVVILAQTVVLVVRAALGMPPVARSPAAAAAAPAAPVTVRAWP